MAVKTYKPVTPSRRNMTSTDFSVLTKVAPYKALLKPSKKHAGRNSYGRITVRHRGGGNKVRYRCIDFKRDQLGNARVLTVEYDPNRSAFISLVEHEDKKKKYILSPHGISAGATISAGPSSDIKPGNSLQLKNIPVGTFIHNIELHP